MEKIESYKFQNTYVITLPSGYRNKVWSDSFGKIQNELRNISENIKEVIVDATNCKWADPMPLLSLIIALAEIDNSKVLKKLYLPLLYPTKLGIEQKRFLAFIEKEGFINNLLIHGVKIQILHDNKSDDITEAYRQEIKDYEKYLLFSDSTIVDAKVIDLNSNEIKKNGIEEYIDNELSAIRHRFKKKILGTIEKETFNKINLFLKETIENVFEHAYGNSNRRLVGYYVRYRLGLANNSLDINSRSLLISAIKEEHDNSPRLQRSFVENISSFFEIIVVDAGAGLTNNFFGKDNPAKLFHEAWRKTVGLGSRGSNSPQKNTEFGGLYTLSKLCFNNYLAARDYNEWLGDELPIVSSNPAVEANKSYLRISANEQIEGLGIIGRISWKSVSDEINSWKRLRDVDEFNAENKNNNPFILALNEIQDIYTKYYSKHFNDFIQKPFFIKDDRFELGEIKLNDYLAKRTLCEYFIYLPAERLTKNKIYDTLCLEVENITVSNKVIIIADISVWEANLYQLSLEKARYPSSFLQKFDKIVLISRRLSVQILIKENDTYISDELEALKFMQSNSKVFSPGESMKHFVEWIRTHDSMIYWQHIKHENSYNEYFLNEKVIWYQDEENIGLNGYLNFAKTLTDVFCKRIYEFSLERSLCLANSSGCIYKSIDVMTDKLSTQYNSLYYNKNDKDANRILLGSVFVSGYSQRATEKEMNSDFKIHFFYHQNVDRRTVMNTVAQLLLWPNKGENWVKENLETIKQNQRSDEYRRVGTSHVIAPFGWKYFPIPRYKLFNEKTNSFLDEFKENQLRNPDVKFKSVYKSTPPETYQDWQGKRNQILSIGHICYESNHDLLKIDFPYLVYESFLIGGRLSQFLMGEFLNALGCDETSIINCDNDNLISGVKKYLKDEYPSKENLYYNSAVIVYPYHFNTEHVVSIIKERIDKKLHSRIIALFPLNKERTDTIFLTSPLTIEAIREKTKDQRVTSAKKDINILMFDDATIAGKTRKEIKHLLFSLGVNNITTLTILERRRLPFNTSNPKFNKAYWRLDLPKLGNSDSCQVCHALRIIRNMESNIASNNIINRIHEIEQIWEQSNPYAPRENQIIVPTNIDLPTGQLKGKFGIYYKGYDEVLKKHIHEQCGGEDNKIKITNSLGLTIYVSELHSMTSRDDIVFKYSSNPQIDDYAKIEMLSTYLLLFGKELSNLTQEKIVKELFEICNNRESSNHTSFALLSLLSQGDNKLECLYNLCKDPGESDIKLNNSDLQILCAHLSVNPDSDFSRSFSLKRIQKGYRNLRDLYKQFHSELYNDYGVFHDNPLQLINKKEYSIKVIRESEDSCDKINYLLKVIPNWYLRTETNENFNYEISIQNINILIREYKLNSTKISNLEDASNSDSLNSISSQIFSSLMPIHNKLFLCVGLRTKDFPLKTSLEQLIIESEIEIGISKQFRKLELSHDLLQIERWITWDKYIERKISYLLHNCRHATDEINDPFNNNDEKKMSWIDVEYFDDEYKLSLVIYNKSKDDSNTVKLMTSKKLKPEKLHLSELEIKIDYQDIIINNIKLLKTIITFPYV